MSRSYRLALRAYPSTYRAQHGEELVATAEELHPGGWSGGEAASLVISGLRTRARVACGGTARGAWTGAVAFAIVFYMAGVVGDSVVVKLGMVSDTTTTASWPAIVAPLAIIAVATLTTRWPFALAVTALAVSWVVQTSSDPSSQVFVRVAVVQALVLSVVAWLIALRGDGRRAASVQGVLGLVAVVAVAGALVGIGIVMALAMLASVVVGLVLIAIDPRPLSWGRHW